jgi:hypothetical protein
MDGMKKEMDLEYDQVSRGSMCSTVPREAVVRLRATPITPISLIVNITSAGGGIL